MASLPTLLRRLGSRSVTAAASGHLGPAAVPPRTQPTTATAAFEARRSMAAAAAPAVAAAGGDALTQLASAAPHVEAIRYEHKNVKWTLQHVNHFSDALANGFLDCGLAPGDVVLSWLPKHFAEEHILQFACSKAGLVLYNLDPSQAITDPEGAKASLARALEVTEANVLVTQEAGSDVNYVKLVKSVIPEIRIFNSADGMPFFSPRFPHLRFPVHTGFDTIDKEGMEALKHMLCPAGTIDTLLKESGAKISGKTPLMGELVTGSDGLPAKGKVLSNEEVVKKNAWPEFNSILKKEYVEVEGVGVVF